MSTPYSAGYPASRPSKASARRRDRHRDSLPRVRGHEVHEVIGKGAGSNIYRATQARTGQEVAIKHVTRDVIRKRLSDTGEQRAYRYQGKIDYASFYDQLKLEHRVCRRLAKTPVRRYVPEVFTLRPVRSLLMRTEGYNLFMEYVPGSTLREKRDYSIPEICTFYYQTARILYALHGMGLLHCDLKPQHFVITPEGRLKLLDYGQCRELGDKEARLQGTPDYMAPEQLKGRKVDQMTDIYGLGASFYWILTGQSNRPAMVAGGQAISESGFTVSYSGRATSIRERNPQVPVALEQLILDSCEPEAEKRPASMREVMERLNRIPSK